MNRSLVLSRVASNPTLPFNRDDEQMPSITVRKSRRQIEYDAQALSNRITLLQKEESKIWKNLELAKVKAQEVYLMKKREAERNKERMVMFEETQDQLSERTPHINSSLIRKQRELKINFLKEAIQNQKHKEMLEIKKQSEIFKTKKYDLEERIRQENQARMLNIKKQEILGSLKKKAHFEEKIYRIKQDQQRKLEEDEEQRLVREIDVLNMEKLEMDLVQRIQQTKSMQKQVYKDLENILADPAEGYIRDSSKRRSASVLPANKYSHDRELIRHESVTALRNEPEGTTTTQLPDQMPFIKTSSSRSEYIRMRRPKAY